MTTDGSAPLTIPGLFAATVARRGDEAALGVIRDAQLRWRNWRSLGNQVAAWADELAARGVARGDRVAQFGLNSTGWIVGDLAIQSLGAVHVPLHAALAGEQAAEQVAHSQAKLVLAQDEAAAGRLAGQVGRDAPVVTHAAMPPEDGAAPAGALRTGGGLDDLATILYTSGTTGAPRGVMLTQRNLTTNTAAMIDAVEPEDDETRLCVLPLSHIYARTCDLYCWVFRGTRLVLPESRETVLRDCKLARPTVLNAVPYFYQKVADGLRGALAEVSPAALRDALGGEITRCYCGGAALPPEVEQFFAERQLPILSGYGLTEASPVITASHHDRYAPGTVGRPLANLEVRLAADGEIEARGESIMPGYWRNEADTRAVLADGWLHTGDLGEWDGHGNLRIVGRKKEMLVLSTGKKVAPTRIEQLLLGSPWIEQCCVVGDGRKCLAAIVVPNGDALRAEIARRRLFVWSKRRALNHPQVIALYREEIDRCLAGAADFEQVAAFTLIGRGFSAEAGEVTPKLSLRRSVVEQNFSREIEQMYARPSDDGARKRC
jgi:long-chain acyl-CoA synthetase